MKITANRKEDILRRKAEYEADVAKRQAEYDAQYEEYGRAQEAVYAPVREQLEDMFKKYPRLDTEINVEDASFRGPGLRVGIRVNDRDVHDKKKALSWNYDAYLGKDGEVIRETGSWSGLNAVTEEQLEQLEQSLQALKELKDLDWRGLLDKTMPDYKDYIKIRNPSWERDKPDFKKELREAELEEIIGQPKWIEVDPFPSSWYYPKSSMFRANNVYVAIVKDSGSQYTIKEMSKYEYNNSEDKAEFAKKKFENTSDHRVKKDQIKPVEPINIVDAG